MASINFFLATLACLNIGAGVSNAVNLNLNSNFKVEYQINNATQTIDFVIDAKTTGWVALGFNNNTDLSMYSTDYMMAYRNATSNITVVGDYFLPPNLGGNVPRAPQRDPPTSQDWTWLNTTVKTENNVITSIKIAARRPLNVTTSIYDRAITNSSMTLIWAYNNATTNLTQMHTAMGSRKLNNVYTEKSDSGAAIMSVGISTLLLAFTTALLK